jgi:D-serine deaminase-like pyridoxal phosphate-dependent protein
MSVPATPTSVPTTVTAKGAWDPAHDGPHHVLGPGAHLPVMTLRESAIANNIEVMQAFTERHDLLFAPHMKTHMAPALAARQIAAGAWGVTIASVQQAMVAWEHGVHHLLVANEALDPTGIAWLATRRTVDADADVLCSVDSEAGVAAAARAVADARAAGAADAELHVLVEVGFPGGRTGVRTDAEALVVARAAQDAGLVVRGVTGYEGGLPTVDEAREYVARVLGVTREVESAGLVDDEPVLLSMGGSAYFDAVVDALDDRGDISVVLRSGAYLTHDDGAYERKTPFHRIPEEGSLIAAIEVWGRVTSTPEPGLALVAVGKRDVPFDEGLPVVRTVRPGGSADVPGIVPPPGAVTVTRMDDQHAYLSVDAAAGASLAPGDVVVLGISHPCTAFDKWRQVHLVDDDDLVVETIATWF